MLLLTLALGLACDGAKLEDTETPAGPGPEDSAAPGDDTAAPADDSSAPADDTADETGGPGGDTEGGGDTEDTGEPLVIYDTPQVSGVLARINDTIGSVVHVSWDQLAPGTVWVEFSFDKGEWHSSPPEEVGAGAQEHLLLGVPFDTEVQFRVVNDFSATGQSKGPLLADEASITTDPLDEDAPQPTLVEGDPTAWDPDSPYVFLTMLDDDRGELCWAFIIDRQGRVVWAWEMDRFTISLHAHLSYLGDQLLIDLNTYWSGLFDAESSSVIRMNIAGEVLENIPTPGLHHPFTELDDGTIAWAAIDDYNEQLMLSAPDGTISTLWDCYEFLDAVDGRGYCGSNTLRWDARTDSFLYSFYSLETMVEIDRSSGETLRWLGHLGGSWEFVTMGDAFWWQHGGHFTEAGTLLLSSKDRDNGFETVVNEYSLDEKTQTMTRIWTFGDGEGIYGDVMGEAHRLGNGNTLHNYGSGTRLREISPDGVVVWDVDWGGDYMGRSTAIADLYTLR